MTRVHPVSEKVSVGGQPGSEDLRRLRASGFTTVVNLRLDNEAEGMPSVAEEGEQAIGLGLAYRHVPVTLAGLAPAQVEAVRAAIEAAPGPVYVHCGAGQRACALALLATATGRVDVAAAASAAGFPITDARLARFVADDPQAV